MNLDETQIDDLIRSPKHRSELEASEEHHRRLAFHSDIVLRKEHSSMHFSSWLAWVSRLLPKDKKARIEDLVQFPLATNELTKDIFIALERVWAAKDFTEKFVFASDEYEEDFRLYLESIKAKHLWKVESWSKFKTKIDSVVVVDLPEMQLTDRPDPYFYFIDTSQIIDMGVTQANEMKYIIFVHTKDHKTELVVYDSKRMRKYAFDNKKRGALTAEVAHDLGYCPARMFWSDKLQTGNNINKRSPLTDSLGAFDWLLFFKTSKKYLDLHAAYPIYITYDIESEDEDDNKPTWYEGQRKETDHKGKGLMGPGSFMTVPPPNIGQPDMMSNPIQVVDASIDSCKYSVEEDERLELDIYTSCVGADGEINKEAINEKQVEASFKSREDVLMNVARNYSAIMRWTYETLGRLRYGYFFVSCVVDFGEDFFLEGQKELMEAYSNAKENGVSPLVLDSMNEKLMDLTYKHQSKERERAEVFKHLDPLPEVSIQEAKDLVPTGAVSLQELRIKINLLKYIRMFELDYGNVVDFMPNNFSQKIAFINQIFIEYAMQQEPTVQPQGE